MRLGDIKKIKYGMRIEILREIGIPLGFENDSQVYSSPFVKERETIVIVTSINPECWQDLYDLEFNLGDEPGSLAAVAALFSR